MGECIGDGRVAEIILDRELLFGATLPSPSITIQISRTSHHSSFIQPIAVLEYCSEGVAAPSFFWSSAGLECFARCQSHACLLSFSTASREVRASRLPSQLARYFFAPGID